MRNVCQVDILVGAKERGNPPLDVARRLFEELKGCRPLTVTTSGARFSIKVLLPEVPLGYDDSSIGRLWLKQLFELGMSGKGSVLMAVRDVREATAIEILDRGLALARRR